MLSASASAQESTPDWRLIGDVGAGLSIAASPARGLSSGRSAIPYVNADLGPVFARVDTFGYKLLPVGDGNLELVARALEDGYLPAPLAGAQLAARASSRPLGLGTFQTTPAGAFIVNLFHDFGKSKGALLDATYAAEFDRGRFAFYPELGVEYRSGAYVRHFYGLSPQEAAQSGLPAYQPGAALNRFLGLFAEIKLGGHWYATANLRASRLAAPLAASPLIARRFSSSAVVALAYRFE